MSLGVRSSLRKVRHSAPGVGIIVPTHRRHARQLRNTAWGEGMDRDRFDGFARLFGSARTRRSALGAILGAAVLGIGSDWDAGGARRKKGNGQKGKKGKKPHRPRACYGSNACPPPESGKDLDDCDYSGTDVFVEASAGGTSFRRSNFAGAVLDGANLQGTKFLNANLSGASLLGVDLRGASLNGACLLNTDFTGFLFEGPILDDAILCNTRVGPSDAEVSFRDCDRLPRCCKALPELVGS